MALGCTSKDSSKITFSFPLAVVTVSLADPWTLQHLKRDHKALLARSTPAISDWYIWIRDFVIYSTSSHSKERYVEWSRFSDHLHKLEQLLCNVLTHSTQYF